MSGYYTLLYSETIVTIVGNRSLGHFRVDSYLAALLNYGFMIMFGIVRPSQLLTFIDIVGFVVEMIYVGIFIRYANNNGKVFFNLVP